MCKNVWRKYFMYIFPLLGHLSHSNFMTSGTAYWIMVKHIIMLHVYSCNTCKYNYKCFLIGMLSIWALLLKKSLLLSGHISIYSTVTAIVFRVYNVKPSSAIVLWALLTRHQCKVFYTRVTALVFLAVL